MEFNNPNGYRNDHTDAESNMAYSGSGFGFAALVLSIISLFVWPVILGIAAIITGLVAIRLNSRGMGYAAILLGGFSVVAGLLIYPFF